MPCSPLLSVLRHPSWRQHRLLGRPLLGRLPLLPHRCFASGAAGAEASAGGGATAAGRRRWLTISVGVTAAYGGALAADEGLRRCTEFWLVVLPIYLHYLYVDRVSHPASAAEETAAAGARAAAFDRLHERYSPVVERACLRMRGFYLKAAQIMSMRDDFLPEPYLRWTKRLQNEAPVALAGPEARRCIVRELGLEASEPGDVGAVFEDFEDAPIGSASIGQVFRARLRSTGEAVAVKVQSPGVENLFRADIRTLKFFTAFALPWAVENMNAIEKMFQSEFDYNLERRNLEVIRESLQPKWGHRIHVPKPFGELCTRHVLCMELLQGEKLVDGVRRRFRTMAASEGRDPEAYEQEHLEALRTGRTKAQSARVARWRTSVWRLWRRLRWGERGEVLDLAEIMETLLAIHGEQVFQHGVFNADPHPGNILLLEDGHTLGLIDFGQVRDLPVDFRLRLAQLVVALARRDAAAVARLERECGMRTKHQREDVRYRICSFWLDRDTEDVMQGLNLHDFMAWGEREDPVLEYPEDLYLVCRCSFMIRSLALAFGVRLSTAPYWRPYAEALLRAHGGEQFDAAAARAKAK
mmetsp:Transcript_44690/g.113665  ORF Transcript_44690/g.113665 Transcript_44690/m.113665 type:complete len:583 (+) Transcript_44690:83-1831(+)